MTSKDNETEKYSKLIEKLSDHLEKNSIDVKELDPRFISKLVIYISSSDDLSEFELKRKFLEKGIFSQKQYANYLSAAYIIGSTLDVPNPGNFQAIVPSATLLYVIKCELKAALTKDVAYTTHGQNYMTLPQIKRCLKSVNLDRECDYDTLLKTVKIELGMIKPKENRKKEERKKQRQNKPKIEQIIESPKKEEISELESECYVEFQSTPKKFVPQEPGKKRHQKLKPAFEVSQIVIKVKQKITAGNSEADILNYIQKQTDSDYENAKLFVGDIVYDAIKTALWTNKTTSKNMINYLSKTKQAKLADEYISKNSISETIGIRRINATKDILLKHLSLDELKINWLIDSKLEQYITQSEKDDESQSKTKFVESKNGINASKPVFVTQHLKQRALQRIGMGADNASVLKDMFHNGKTINSFYDLTPRRIFEFSGELFEMPYIDTGEEYVLLTVFPRKKY